MTSEAYPHLDGNAAAGELNRIFAFDITAAEGQCTNWGAKRHFAEAHLYIKCPGLVARAGCGNVLLRLVNAGGRLLLDLRGRPTLPPKRLNSRTRTDKRFVDDDSVERWECFELRIAWIEENRDEEPDYLPAGRHPNPPVD